MEKRKQTRLAKYNYALAGCYFVTICTHNRKHVFGEVRDAVLIGSNAAKVVNECWQDIPNHHPLVSLDEFIVMPNHIHGIIALEWDGKGDAGVAPTILRNVEVHSGASVSGPSPHSLSAIVGSFKSAVSRNLSWRKSNASPLWQRGFFDQVIRDERSLNIIREYTENNTQSLRLDELNAQRSDCSAFYSWLKSEAQKI